jgi:SET domain-containing protein
VELGATVPFLENLRVYRSPIHGYGVVARRDIQADEVIAEVEGVMYRADQLGDDTHCLYVDDDTYFDMVDQTRWINHSCDPNAKVDAGLDEKGEAWARIIAIRAIKAGEEIAYHYGFPWHLAEPCRCGATGCVGWIVDPDELPALSGAGSQ